MNGIKINNMEYRIKIEEKNNGVKWYIPQVRKVKLKIGKFNISSTEWHNIIEDKPSLKPSFWISSFAEYAYNTEQGALDVIEGYKQYLIDEKAKEVKSTTYKTVE